MNINYGLVTRFAQWLLAAGHDSHSASQLLGAAANRSQMVGKRIQMAWDNADLTREQLKAAFNEDEIADLFTIPLKPDPKYDYTRADRTRKRRRILDEKAMGLGFKSLSDMMTQWKNGVIKIKVEGR